MTVLEISALLLAEASDRGVGGVQIINHLPICRVQLSSLGDLLFKLFMNTAIFHFTKKTLNINFLEYQRS